MPEYQRPNLIVIGAMKCGTTSLHYNLDLHPDIAMSREKELCFFLGEEEWSRGLEWYCRQFPQDTPWRGETSPGYARLPVSEGVAARMHQTIPDARLIYMVRSPVDRIISHYVQRTAIGQEHRPIDQAVSDFEACDYVQRSRYFHQLSEYLQFYPASQMHVATLESLHEDPGRVMGDIFRFLGVDDGFTSEQFSTVRHQSSSKGKKNRVGLMLKWLSDTRVAKVFSTDFRMRMGRILYAPFSSKIERPLLGQRVKQELLDYLEDDIAGLEAHTGFDLGHWRT